MKSYSTALAEKTEGTEATETPSVTFEIDGQQVTAYKPGDGQIAVLLTKTGRHASAADMAAAAIDFFSSVLDEKGGRYIEDRLMDRRDPFEVENVLEILFDLVEEWTGRPFVRPSA